MTTQKLSPNFRRIVNDVSGGVVLKPLLQAYLFDARFPDFTIEIKKGNEVRRPDDWFHPSTHPLWPERMLYWYLREPDKFLVEPKEFMGTLSVTIGKIMHDFVGMCLDDHGLTVPKPEVDGCWCSDPNCKEWGFRDTLTGARGHVDGVLALHVPSFPQYERQIFEFKTKTPLAKLPQDLDLDWLKAKHPDYYAQAQEYMRMSGYRLVIILFFSMGYPWAMCEIHIPFDQQFSNSVRDKYLNVRASIERDAMPVACCAPKSKESKACDARTVCPIALEIR